MKKIAIIGAGISGLVFANFLRQNSEYEVTIYEKNNSINFEKAYGIPRDQVIGSTIKTEYDYNDGNPVIRRLAEIDFIDDKEGKPEGIHKYIGRKPVFASGNSDGDLQMLRWTASNKLKSFKLYVHHTDSIREWAYDRNSHIGRLDKGLDEANEKGWTVIDMEKDWKIIYLFELNTK